MATYDDLVAWRDALIRTRAMGIRTVTYEGRTVTYASDIELNAAIADLERRLAAASGTTPKLTIIRATKGI